MSTIAITFTAEDDKTYRVTMIVPSCCDNPAMSIDMSYPPGRDEGLVYCIHCLAHWGKLTAREDDGTS